MENESERMSDEYSGKIRLYSLFIRASNVGAGHRVVSCRRGRPICKNSSPISIIVFPLYLTTHFFEAVNSPMTVASTPRFARSALSFFHFAFGTASVIRSCDSEIQVCHG